MDVQDLCKIENIDEEAIIQTIRKRFECGYCYVIMISFLSFGCYVKFKSYLKKHIFQSCMFMFLNKKL